MMRFRYFEKSMTTATLQHWPARLVPAPRGRIGRAGVAARRDRGRDVGFVERDDEADRDLPVVRRVGRVERARAGVEAHFAAHRLLQRALERLARRKDVARMRV